MALEFWKQKTGPLPNWAWGGLGLGAAVAYSSWRRNKQAGEEEAATSTSSGIELPGDVAPTYVFQNYDQDVTTINTAPAGGGRPPITTLPKPVPWPPAKPKPPARPKPSTPKPPGAPTGRWVTVTKWKAKDTPWNSTIWGITNRLLGPKAQWQSVWNAPQNKALRDKRKDPTKIQPGDKVWVPGVKK